MPIAEISAALTAATHAAKIVKGLHKLGRDTEVNQAVIELQESIIDLQSKIFDIQAKYEELGEGKRNLEQELAELRAAQDVGAALVREGNLYYRVLGETRSGPYCMTCWDDERKLINVIQQPHGTFKCGRCYKQKKGD
jgi:hypothetical protein